MVQRFHRNILITGLTSLLTDVSTEMVYPVLALYLKALGGGVLTLGAIEGIAESLASLLRVFSGALADRMGRRKPLAILGYGLSSIGKVLFLFASGWSFVLFGRVVDRFGKGIRTAPRDAMISESATQDTQGKSFGFHRALDTLGATLGIVVTYLLLARFQRGSIQENLSMYLPTFRLIILVSLIPAFLGVAVLFLSEETGKKRKLSQTSALFSWKNLDLRLKVFLLATLIFTLGNSSNQFILLRAAEKDVGFTPSTVTLLYLLYNTIYTFVSYPAGVLSDRLGRKWVLVGGFLLYAFSYFFIGLVPRYIVFAMLPYGCSSGMTEGVGKAFVADLTKEQERATILGLHATLLGIGLFPASLLAGVLWNAFGPEMPFLFGGSMSLGAAILLTFCL
ncbi:MAG: MFS transporter [Candidatus Caldatribacterium sp.]|uniref:MFS transporter n=1 Tax=Candidatus Caldatribacterium sp. TaxID=2282143 RepID=UPI002994F16E|nr:MFS transporter [Candidatus Caldatribacterium sp.]MCX7729869.1 MFS transporter [Candidatus Caldatribacterium sp.]MDW8082048.1 MFS transporter [Candidatus Calescibacterium sp.]